MEKEVEVKTKEKVEVCDRCQTYRGNPADMVELFVSGPEDAERALIKKAYLCEPCTKLIYRSFTKRVVVRKPSAKKRGRHNASATEPVPAVT